MTVRYAAAVLSGCALIAVSGCGSSSNADHGSSTKNSAGSNGAMSRLWSVSERAARDANAKPDNASAVKTTERRALQFVTHQQPDASSASDRGVWVVQVRGKSPFSCDCGVEPGRNGNTTANYMLILVDSSTYRMVSGAYLYAEKQKLETLGVVVQLHA